MVLEKIKATIPNQGEVPEAILDQLSSLHRMDVDWQLGKTWSMVYHVDEEHSELLKKASQEFFSENFINPMAFRSILQLEREVIDMTSELLHGNPGVVGTMTSGGTESIFLALYTYRERARDLKPGIQRPEIIAPVSIHPAFDKAAHILGIRIRKIALNKNFTVNPHEVEKAINKNTIAIAASAPAYPNGIIDPIEALGKIGEKYHLPFHVDACIGGYMLPWVEKLGYDLPLWDFRVPGVSSISADVHKFGYGAKGASSILYRSIDFLKYQFFVATEWSGGIYAATTFRGSRSGGPIAAAWTAMKSLGKARYMDLAEELMEATRKMRQGLEAIPGIEILGEPSMNVLAFRARNNQPDLFLISEKLKEKGWWVDAQHKPISIHLTIMRYNIDSIDQYLEDLEEALDYAKEHPEEMASGNPAMYGLMARLPFKGMVETNVRNVLGDLYTDMEDSDSENKHSVSPWMGKLNVWTSRWEKFKNRARRLFRSEKK